MTWLTLWPLLGLLAVAALLPLAAVLFRPARARGRREADLALYRAQLAELDRERDAGRLDEAAHRTALLEVQRRLLAAPEEAGGTASGRSRLALLATLILAPAAAFGIYWWNGIPDMPSAPYALRQQAEARDEDVLATLRARLASLPPDSDQARQGWALLANAERSRGRRDLAAQAYWRALEGKFDAGLVGQLAQVLLEDGKTEIAVELLAEALPRAPQDVGLRFLTGLAQAQAGNNAAARQAWQALIAEAPAEAPWRAMVERRMGELP